MPTVSSPKGAKKVVLTAEVEPDLAAMKHVWSNPPESDRTHQHASFRKMKDANPVQFFDRMQELRATAPEGRSEQPWDGEGICPLCKHEKPIKDAGAEKIMALLDELDELDKLESANAAS